MKKIDIKIVIGANYGDEGKGLATRYFTQKGKHCLNVLFNGGPQRGHTVEFTDGLRINRHVCHHIGAGSLDGAATFFDEDFMVSPIFFISEIDSLRYTIPQRQIDDMEYYISPKCRVITPYDSFINQIAENARNSKHGSCGYGIWETQKRYESVDEVWQYEAYETASDKEIVEYLKTIAQCYVPQRLKTEYGITTIPDVYRELIESDRLRRHYVYDLRKMQERVAKCSLDNILSHYDTVIFEGAQGLALDEGNVAAYPHVTASKTGSSIPIKRVRHYWSDIEVCYVTRSYFTRHGAGPFPTECPKEEINSRIIDATNADNEFQGSIRYGRFGAREFIHRVDNDYCYAVGIGGNIKKSLFVTHLNYTNDLAGNSSISRIKRRFDATYCSRTRFAEDVVEI